MSEDTVATSGAPEEGAHAAAPTAPPAPEPTADLSKADADPVSAKLKELGIDDDVIARVQNDLGIRSLGDLSVLTVEDYLGAGVKAVQARRLSAEFAPAESIVESATLSNAAMDILPKPMDDTSWLDAVRATGILKVNEAAYTSAIRAAIADRVGLFQVPDRIVKEMEQFAGIAEEPFGPEYYKLRDQVIRRNYGDLFSAIPGVNGNYVTDKRKRDLLDKIEASLWPAVSGFYAQLNAWQEKWMQTALSPNMLPLLLLGGGRNLPPGTMQAPETGSIRDYADEIATAINKVFAGDGPVIASALAYEASQIRTILEEPQLPQMIGAPNREQMLKQLDVAVSPTDPRLEKNLTTFVLATLKLKDQPSGASEIQYITALYQLGSEIPWGDLGAGGYSSLTGIAGRQRRERLTQL